ncbi:hypothetical protein BKA67DRAFT_570080, partial [Truncatella angustata]
MYSIDSIHLPRPQSCLRNKPPLSLFLFLFAYVLSTCNCACSLSGTKFVFKLDLAKGGANTHAGRVLARKPTAFRA